MKITKLPVIYVLYHIALYVDNVTPDGKDVLRERIDRELVRTYNSIKRKIESGVEVEVEKGKKKKWVPLLDVRSGKYIEYELGGQRLKSGHKIEIDANELALLKEFFYARKEIPTVDDDTIDALEEMFKEKDEAGK